MNKNAIITFPSPTELEITRVFNAPRKLVWDAITKPEHVRNWYGPRSLANVVLEMDFRVGGRWRIVQRAPDGSEHPFSGQYLEIVDHERLIQTELYEPMPGTEYVAALTLREEGDTTVLVNRLKYKEQAHRDGHAHSGMEAGMNESYARIDALLEAQAEAANTEIVTRRVLRAPRDLVWKALTDPAKIARWWGPDGFTNTIHSMDVRVGGDWRFAMHGPDGTDYPNHIRYTEVSAPDRLVFDHGTDIDAKGPEFRNTITLESLPDGNTRITMRARMPSVEARAAVLKFGADEGGRQTLNRLAVHVVAEGAAADPVTFEFTRTFDAPRDLVWRAYTEAAHLEQWWGPAGSPIKVEKLDVRPQGMFLYSGSMGGTAKTFGKFQYHQVLPRHRLVYCTGFTDADGNFVRAPFSAEFPIQVLNIVDFDETDGKTTIHARGIPYEANDAERAFFQKMHGGLSVGFKGTLDQFEKHLEQEKAKMSNKTENQWSAAMMFVNIPVRDLAKSMAFYSKLGFVNNPQFTDETAACMVVNERVYFMLLTEAKFKEFAPKPVGDTRKSASALYALSCTSRDHVTSTIATAVANGGRTYSEPKDYGFMLQHGFEDPDGHIIEVMFMEPSHVQ